MRQQAESSPASASSKEFINPHENYFSNLWLHRFKVIETETKNVEEEILFANQ